MQKKLTEAREAQASAMSRFIQARARVMEVEARLQAMHTRLAITHMLPDQPSEPTDPASNPAISKADISPAAQVMIPPVNSSNVSAQTTDPLTNPAPTVEAPTPLFAKQFRIPGAIAEQAANDLEASTHALDHATPVHIDEDEEETKKMPALRPMRSASSPQQNPGAEEMANATLSALPQSEQSNQTSASDETREAGTTDITAKIPIIRQEHDQTQEAL
jgi:hypothetical protein